MLFVMPQVDIPTLGLLLGRHHGDVLLKHFVGAGVRFLVVGGCALAGWGLREVTDVDDMDLLAEPSLKNAQALLIALSAAGISICASANMLSRPNQQLPLKNMLYYAELLTPRQELSFEDAYTSAASVSLFGVELRVASRGTLIQMKELAVASLDAELEKHKKDLHTLRGANHQSNGL